MKEKSDKNIDALFQLTKETPLEIPLEKAEKMILNFPEHPISIPQKNQFAKFFKLKYIAMTIISFIAVLSLWWSPITNETGQTTTASETTETPVVILEQPDHSSLVEPSNSETFSDEIIPLPATVLIPETSANKHTRISVPEIENDSITIGEQPKKFDTADGKKNRKEYTYQNSTSYIKPDLITETTSPLPEISSQRLKKLRRILYKNLINDGLINSKFILVEIQLQSDQIRINEHPIPDKFIIKYQNLTGIVGSGPERKIKMNPEFILAGDFGESGFRGHGVGTFNEKIMEIKEGDFPSADFRGTWNLSTDSLDHTLKDNLLERLLGKEDYLEMENKALKLFANKIQQNTPNDTGKKRLFSPNLNGEKGKNLHAALKVFLEEDAILNSQNEFAVIHLPKNKIRINGEELTGKQREKYLLLIDQYGIKHGRNRMVLFSPHFLKAGNFTYGNFTGAIITLPLED